jgi:hypothetical protein
LDIKNASEIEDARKNLEEEEKIKEETEEKIEVVRMKYTENEEDGQGGVE